MLKWLIAVLAAVLLILLVLFFVLQNHLVFSQEGVHYSFSQQEKEEEEAPSQPINIVIDHGN